MEMDDGLPHRDWRMANDNRIKLSIEQLISQLADSPKVPGPESEKGRASIFQEIIETTFWASHEREEGRFVQPAVALVNDEMMSAQGVNRKDWEPIKFESPKPFDIATLVKLAPAVDRRQTLIAVTQCAGELVVAGVIRRNTEHYRVTRGESSVGSCAGYYPLIVTVTDVGSVSIDVGIERFAVISKGVVLTEGVDVLSGGIIWDLLCQHSKNYGLGAGDYSIFKFLRRVLVNLADRGHGGVVLILPDNNRTFLREVYALDQVSSALTDAIRFSQGERLGPRIYTRISRPEDLEPDPTALEIERQRKQAVEESRFEENAIGFTSDLASIDGALALAPDLSIIAFGARMICNEPVDVPVRLAIDQTGRNFDEAQHSPLAQLGTRHNSTARFCYNRPGALAFVVSQDGVVSCMTRYQEKDEWVKWGSGLVSKHR